MNKRSKTNSTKRWKKSGASPRRRDGKRTLVSGRGRYLLAFLLAVVVLHYIGMPVVEKIKAHSVFTVRHVLVEGADYLDTEKVIETAAIPMGENVFEIDFTEISRHLKQEYAAEEFAIFRRLPDTITVRVTEREPVALLNVKDIIGVDAEGVPLPHIGATMVETLPIVTGIDTVTALTDSTVKSRLIAGLQLLGRISDESPAVYNRISEVDVSTMSEMGITLIDNGLEVIIGSDNWARKMPVLERVVTRISEGMEARAVDIRFGEKIFVRKK